MAEPEDGGQFNRITSVADILNQQAIRASSTQEATGETPKCRGMSDRYLSLIHRGHVGTVYVPPPCGRCAFAPAACVSSLVPIIPGCAVVLSVGERAGRGKKGTHRKAMPA